ncbi:hypothetical protein BKA65DRAFT_580887 [Rhexocercosporidium sp. MPI-PUGE-AT-0058]|nr:hypothetical protein BKA65DRAFT_580887 [Rhexocercosporidium sp. MPI-PUGE-AT-0058]
MRISREVLLAFALACNAVTQEFLAFDVSGGNDAYLIAKQGTGPVIYCANTESNAVKRTCKDFASDFGKVVGTNGTVLSSINATSGPVIIAGTVGRSSLLDTLISRSKIDASSIIGKWESYIATGVSNPVPGVSKAVVIVGSDRRGTIFGMYEISQRMGVSPWYWWADVPIKTKQSISATGVTKIGGPPSVKWRGIFINDESPALSSWIVGRFPHGPTGSDFSDGFYARIYELLPRSKANYMWPAMWGKSFYVETLNNGAIAEDYGIVMGTSHHEPMARSEKEQQQFNVGAWDWDSNKANVIKFFTHGARRSKNKETMFTVGMRGSGDAANTAFTSRTLQDIVDNQQRILQTELGRDINAIPQAWVLYKEVGSYYQADDNWGNIQHVPLANETSHPAGHGVYYHFDYVGSVRNYKWINTIQLIKTWEQMHLAHEKGAREIWIANVGDLKPLINRWAGESFNPSIAAVTTEILTTYGRLVVRRKYELLSNTPFVWSTANYDEAELVLQEWVDLLAKTQQVYDSLKSTEQLPYFQMVLHPVLAGKTMIELYITAAVNLQYRSQNRVGTNDIAKSVIVLFNQDDAITKRYHGLAGGRWNGIVNQQHIGYTSWQEPSNNIRPPISWYGSSNVPTGSAFAVAAQGAMVFTPGNTLNNLYSMDPYMPPLDKRWFEVFAIGRMAHWLTLSPPTPPPARRTPVQITITVNSETVNLVLPVNKRSPPGNFSGHVETGSVVSMEVDHYASIENKNGVTYQVIPEYGRTRAGLKTWPVTSPSQNPTTGPKVVYSFYTYAGSSSASLTLYFGGSINHDPSRQLKYALSVDDGSATTVQYVPNHTMGSLPSGWEGSATAGGWTSTTNNLNIPAGARKLNIWLLEPGVVLQKVLVNLGGLHPSANGPQENVIVKTSGSTEK